ncbi:hypothetical protein D9611_014231 [Ephemerocybe angulata]|uniref:Uncharacterized protein n=1 Tax=Ephemerocybe angulata TaxID=980116 RepID=A0A8H5B836_9AGAR|nr:hypothetical protein D9611_014231 [Tulosesus angulatus]
MFKATRTNLELAISEVLSESPSAPDNVPLSKLICAYIRIAGFSDTDLASDALPSFERALEKHRDAAFLLHPQVPAHAPQPHKGKAKTKTNAKKNKSSKEKGDVMSDDVQQVNLPSAPESEEAKWERIVAKVRKEYWRDALARQEGAGAAASTLSGNYGYSGCAAGGGVGRKTVSCPCCGKLARAEEIRRALALDDSGEQGQVQDLSSEYPKRTVKKRKAKRGVQSRKKTKEGASRVAFDPYGPSTSKVSM